MYKRQEDGEIVLYVHGAKAGKKMELIAKNPKVGFEMDNALGLDVNPELKECSMNYELSLRHIFCRWFPRLLFC